MLCARRPPLYRIRVLALTYLSLFSVICCSREPQRQGWQAEGKTLASAAALSTSARPVAQRVEPTTLLAVAGSAYSPALVADEDGSYLLASNAAYRLVPGHAPQRWPLDLGISPTTMSDQFLFWSSGAIRQVHQGGGEPTVVVELPARPQRIVASWGRFAWLEHSKKAGRFTLRTVDGSRVRTLYSTDAIIATLAMQDERIYFVEQVLGAGWRLGAVSLSGEPPRFTESRTGRTPAMLALAHAVFFFDGPSLSVRRVSSDLSQETVIAKDTICSPLAVAEYVYCAQPGGLVELGLDGVVRRTIPLGQRGLVTAVVATAHQLTWLMDVGREQLAVKSLPLAPDSDAVAKTLQPTTRAPSE